MKKMVAVLDGLDYSNSAVAYAVLIAQQEVYTNKDSQARTKSVDRFELACQPYIIHCK